MGFHETVIHLFAICLNVVAIVQLSFLAPSLALCFHAGVYFSVCMVWASIEPSIAIDPLTTV